MKLCEEYADYQHESFLLRNELSLETEILEGFYVQVELPVSEFQKVVLIQNFMLSQLME